MAVGQREAILRCQKYFGALDLAGFWKDAAWWYAAAWTDDPVLHVFPGWAPPVSAARAAGAAGDGAATTAATPTPPACGIGAFPASRNITGQGLLEPSYPSWDKYNITHRHPADEAECAQTCCEVGPAACSTYNWCPPDTAMCKAQAHTCYIGIPDGSGGGGWVGGSRPAGPPLLKLAVHSNADVLECVVTPADGSAGYSLGRVVLSPLGLTNTAYDSVEFKPGRLECTGYKNGTARPYASQTLLTPGVAAALRLSAEMNQSSLVADAQDVALIRVEVVDAAGTVVPTASDLVSFTVHGPGRVLGVGNGDPHCHEPDKASQRSAFHGLVRVIVQSDQLGAVGAIVLRAEAPGLAPGTVSIDAVVGAADY